MQQRGRLPATEHFFGSAAAEAGEPTALPGPKPVDGGPDQAEQG